MARLPIHPVFRERRATDPDDPPPRPRRRPGRRAALVLIGLVAVFGLYAADWLLVAVQVQRTVAGWAEARRAEGYAVTWAEDTLGGFPFAIEKRIARPVVRAPRGAWSWTTDEIRLSARPWHWFGFTMHVPGVHRVAWRDAGADRAVKAEAESLVARIGLDPADWTTFDLEAGGLTVTEGTAVRAALERARFRLERLAGMDADYRTRVATLGLTAEAARIPALRDLPLGTDVQRLDLKASLFGGIDGGTAPDALAAWRDAGGVVEIERLSGRYGPLKVDASGTLALDGALQPVGAFTVRLQGFFEAVDALGRARLVEPGAALTAKLVLGALAKRPEDGGPPVLNLALTLQDRMLHVGPVALMELPPVAW